MKPEIVLAYEFVEFIPDELKERTLYISHTYCTAVHKCCCGCGREVVTPFSPTGWELTFDGKTVSLYPSIGSWSLPCQSHYFITKNKVVWTPTWTKKQVARGRAREARAKEKYFAKTQPARAATKTPSASPLESTKPKESDAPQRKPKLLV
ncbi:MAG: hypothetical protein LAN71_02745 [Acidobacteriia bacterium]|nr:hypothetical protein [Terriglobia bacterium]